MLTPLHTINDDSSAVPTKWVQDGNLSLRARGLLMFICSHDEVPLVTEMVQQNPEGRDAIRKALRELEEAGYLIRRTIHARPGQARGSRFYLADMGDAA